MMLKAAGDFGIHWTQLETVNYNSLPCNGKRRYREFQQDHQEFVEEGSSREIKRLASLPWSYDVCSV